MSDRKRNNVHATAESDGDKRMEEIEDSDDEQSAEDHSTTRMYYSVDPRRLIRLFPRIKADAQKNALALGIPSRPIMVPPMFKLALGIEEPFLPSHTLAECSYLIRSFYIMYFDDEQKVVDQKTFRVTSSVTSPVVENDFLLTRAPVRDGEVLPVDERRCFYHEMHAARETYMVEADAALKAEDVDLRLTLLVNAWERFYYKMLYLDEQCARRRSGSPLDAPSVRIEVMRSRSGRVAGSHIRTTNWPITIGYIRSPDAQTDTPTLNEITFLTAQKEDCVKFNAVMREWEERNGFAGITSLPPAAGEEMEYEAVSGASAPNGA